MQLINPGSLELLAIFYGLAFWIRFFIDKHDIIGRYERWPKRPTIGGLCAPCLTFWITLAISFTLTEISAQIALFSLASSAMAVFTWGILQK